VFECILLQHQVLLHVLPVRTILVIQLGLHGFLQEELGQQHVVADLRLRAVFTHLGSELVAFRDCAGDEGVVARLDLQDLRRPVTHGVFEVLDSLHQVLEVLIIEFGVVFVLGVDFDVLHLKFLGLVLEFVYLLERGGVVVINRVVLLLQQVVLVAQTLGDAHRVVLSQFLLHGLYGLFETLQVPAVLLQHLSRLLQLQTLLRYQRAAAGNSCFLLLQRSFQFLYFLQHSLLVVQNTHLLETF